MKKLFTLFASFLLLGVGGYAQDAADGTFQFVDAEGNTIADGSVITVTEINEEGQLVVPLYVKNMSGKQAAVSMYETIDAKPNGEWQTCAFGNCMVLSGTGYSAKSIVAADYNTNIQTEWIPAEGGYATWEATLQIHVFNITTKSQFGQFIEQPGDEIIGYGPKITVRFEYKDPNAQERPTAWWGYVGENDEVYGVGTNKAETYHCAAFYAGSNEMVAAKTLRAVRFNLLATNVKNVKVWIAKTPPTTVSEANVIQLVNVENPVSGTNEITLPEPYLIEEKGVYVGYTFTISKLATQGDRYPVAITGLDMDNALWLKTSSTTTWSNMNGQGFGRLYLQLLLEGDFHANAAAFDYNNLGESIAVQGETATLSMPVTNAGTELITNIDYTITADGATGDEQHIDLQEALETGSTEVFNISVNADRRAGVKDKTLTITKVNGKPNESSRAQTQFTLSTITRKADRVAVIEDFTGTGCGWCPRGIIGMEKIRNTFGEKAIGIAIHAYNGSTSSDAMNISTYNQVSFTSAPSCRVDRGDEIDPYYGSSNTIIDNINAALAVPTRAVVSVTGEWSADGKKVNATATIESLLPNQSLKIEYVLVADGLKGTGSAWNQSNYYYEYAASQLPEDLSIFGNGGKYGTSSVSGLTFNDVAIAVVKSSQTTALGTLNGKEPVTNTYSITMPTRAALLNAIKTDKVSVVALLINDKGTIENAAKYQMPEYVDTSGISTVQTGDDVTSQQHYSIDGRQLPASQKGLNIIRMADGSIRKVVVK